MPPVLRFGLASRPVGVTAYFSAMEALGDRLQIAVGHAASDGDPVVWSEFPHAACDGIGAVLLALRARSLCAGPVPRREERPPPGWLRSLQAIVEFLAVNRVRRQRWQGRDWSRRGRSRAIAAHSFGAPETEELLRRARDAKLTVTPLLLHALSCAAAPLLAAKDDPQLWMIPVNLRDSTTDEADTTNHSSYLAISCTPGSPPAAVQERMARQLERRFHRAALLWLGLLARLGARCVRALLAFQSRLHHSWTGTLSNLGAWRVSGGDRPDAASGIWFIVPPVTQAYPIGAGCITVDGRLGVALHLHPSLAADPAPARRCLEAWVAEIKNHGKR